MFQWVYFSRRWTCLALVTLGLALASVSAGYARTEGKKIQAVFLFKFFDYIAWPDGADKKTICTYGGNPFGSLLNQIAKLQQNKVIIRHVKDVTMLAGCHILYVIGPLPKLSREPVLTVSAQPDFARHGGMVEMREDNGKIAMIINLRAMDSAGIKASARLLKLAEVIR